LESDEFIEGVFFKNLYNWGLVMLWIKVCLLDLWKTLLLSMSLMNLWIANFLFRYIGFRYKIYRQIV